MNVTKIINFGHPLSETVIDQLNNPEIENIKVQIDLDTPVAPQIQTIISEINTSLDGTVAGLAIVLPGMSEATAHIIADIHGRMGSFPTIIPLRRDNELGIFVVANEGIQSLENVRQESRKYR